MHRHHVFDAAQCVDEGRLALFDLPHHDEAEQAQPHHRNAAFEFRFEWLSGNLLLKASDPSHQPSNRF